MGRRTMVCMIVWTFLPSCAARRIERGMCVRDYGCLANAIPSIGIMIATKPYHEHTVCE